MKALTKLVIDYIEAEGIGVVDSISLEIQDNFEVGVQDPLALVDISKSLELDSVDALVLSACVQMPSLEAVPIVEEARGLPVISTAIATTYQMLERLQLRRIVPDAGALLSGRH